MALKSLQQRLIVLILLPVALFLAAMGTVGYLYIRNTLLTEWQDAARLRLERAAHFMDMRLSAPIRLMAELALPAQELHVRDHQAWVLQRLKDEPSLKKVTLTWQGQAFSPVAKVTPPQFLLVSEDQAVVLRSQLLDMQGRSLGRLEVELNLDFLMEDVRTSGWMQSNMACLVNQEGRYLAHSNPKMAARRCLGETGNPLELALQADLAHKPYGTYVGGGEVIGYYRLHNAPWVLMLHARPREILAPIRQFQVYYLLGGLFCLAVILLLIRVGVNPIIIGIRRVSAKAAQVAQGDYGEPLESASQDEIGRLTASFNDMVTGLKERDFIRNTFGRYVDEDVARELLRLPEARRLCGEKRQVAILFSDLRGFTPMAESLSPEDTIALVNRHFTKMIQVVRQHQGIIVDFLGDALLAFFDPLEGPLPPKALQAVRCALAMQAAQTADHAAATRVPTLEMGVGVHAGEVVVGNIGSESRAKYGIVGAPVNFTHRVQGQARGGEVVISQAVYALVKSQVAVTRQFHSHLKGLPEPVNLYAVSGLAAEG